MLKLDQLAQLQLDCEMSKLFTGAEIVFKCLEDQKVEYIFGYPGGAVLPIYDELKNFDFIIWNFCPISHVRSRPCSLAFSILSRFY